MAYGRRHLTRHDMKGDEFVSWVTHATIWIENNTRTVLIALGALAAGVVAVIGIFTWMHSRQESAYASLGDVQQAAGEPLAGEPGAAPGAPATAQERAQRTLDAADRMLREAPGGQATDWARYHRAAALIDIGRNDEALTALEPLLGGGRTLLATMSQALAGRAEEAKKNFQKAADHYAAAASGAAKDFPVEIALMGQARCLDALGKKEEAISAYQKVVDAYPDSPYAAKAGEKIQGLKG